MPRKPRILPRIVPPRGEIQNDTGTVESFLIAYGDAAPPLAATIRTLDEIVTDYIIETCHEAAAVATHARRQKIKLDDFKFMLRRDEAKLGRVSELLETDKDIKRKRRAFDTDEGAVVQGVDDKDGEKDKEKKGKGADKEKDSVAGADEERRKKKRKKDKGKDDASTVG